MNRLIDSYVQGSRNIIIDVAFLQYIILVCLPAVLYI
jgi:hypothetical protein